MRKMFLKRFLYSNILGYRIPPLVILFGTLLDLLIFAKEESTECRIFQWFTLPL